MTKAKELQSKIAHNCFAAQDGKVPIAKVREKLLKQLSELESIAEDQEQREWCESWAKWLKSH